MLPETGTTPSRKSLRRSSSRGIVVAAGAVLAGVTVAAGTAWASASAGHGWAPSSQTAVIGQSGHGSDHQGGGSTNVDGWQALPNTPIVIGKGGEFVVWLREQAGTSGYSWSAKITGGALAAAGDHVVHAAKPMAGAVEDHVFTFRGSGRGTASVTFTLTGPTGKQDRTTTVTAVVDRSATVRRVIYVSGQDNLPGSPVAARVGDTLVVGLDEQAGSTGYSWAPVRVPAGFSLAQDITVPGTGPVGAPGPHLFAYRVGRPGSAALEFGLRRPWQSGAAAARAEVSLAAQR